MRCYRKVIVLLLCMLSVISCADDVQTTYSRYRAYFYYDKVLTTQPLLAALTGTESYCSIAFQNGKIRFSSLTNSYEQAVTSVRRYEKLDTFNGFIVGMANMPELGETTLPLLCFDRVCPNCLEEGYRPSLGLRENGYAYCSRCKRTYDMNNLGIITDGEKGLKMHRYRIFYDGDNVMEIVNN